MASGPIAAAAAARSLQSCPTLCDAIDGSPPGSAIRGILQARTLEWVAVSFSTNYRIVATYTLYGTMDWFKIGKRVHQGCIWSPCLFNLYPVHDQPYDQCMISHVISACAVS